MPNKRKLLESIRSFEQAIQLDPMNRDAWYNRAKVYQTFNRPKECLYSFECALRTDKKEFDADVYEGIIDLCNKVLIRQNTNPGALRAKASALVKLERWEETNLLLDRVIKKRNDDYLALTLAGFVLYLNKRFDPALAYVDRALRIKDDHIFAWYVKGLVTHHTGYHTEAVRCFNNALGMDPNYTDAIEKRSEAILALRESNVVLGEDEIEHELMSRLDEEVF